MNILEALPMAGVEVRKVANTKGGEYAGPCPGCREGTDRFIVWPATKGGEGSYWCRQCGRGGDLVQFLKEFCGYEYKDAFAAAGRSPLENYRPERYKPAVSGSAPRKNNLFEPRHCEDPVETWQLRAEKLVSESHAALLKYDKGLDYLAGRGLDKAAVRRFRLGWFAGEKNKPCAFRPRLTWGLNEVKNEKTGRPKMLWIPRGFIIPCHKSGKVHRIRIRRPKADLQRPQDKKYYVMPGSGMDAFGVNPGHRVVVVVEAELDAMLVAEKAGHLAGVVALGSASTRPADSVYYHMQKALRVLVALDYDAAGQGKTGWKWWKDNFKNAKLWPVPQGKDPGDALELGVDIDAWVRAGLPPAACLSAASMGYIKPAGLTHLEELQQLLSRYPIKLRATEQAIEIIYTPGFKNQAIRQRVKELFLDDDEVQWFLRWHPDEIITGVNCNFDAFNTETV